MNLVIATRAEILKTKRSASMYLTMIAAAFGPFMSLLDLLLDGVPEDHKKDILNDLLTTKFQITGGMLLPFFIMLICTLLPQIEYRNNAWKQVLTSPLTKANIFIAKFINIQRLILLFLTANIVFMFAAAVIVHFVHPSLNVFSHPLNVQDILMSRINSYTVLLAMCVVQFWLGLRCRNFIVPLAVGIACWFIGTVMVMQIKSDVAKFFPYSFHMYPNFEQFKGGVNDVLKLSLIYAAVFLILAYFDFVKHEKRKA